MSTQANPILTGLLVAIPIVLTVAIAAAAITCTGIRVSSSLNSSKIFGPLRKLSNLRFDKAPGINAASTASVDIELGQGTCPIPNEEEKLS